MPRTQGWCSAARLRASVLAAAGLFLTFGALEANAARGPIVQTAQGPVQGLVDNGVAEFLGVPYAAAPVGNLRWRPPQPHAAWTKVLKATSFGPTCAQITELGVFAGPPNDNEDCLYLNVYVPQRRQGVGSLPVLVWIHGGGLVDGESNDYDGSALAKHGPMIVVTTNYRLGLLGFLANPALDRENHPFANYGVMDQQLALQWVQANAAAFGGNPHNVTLGGQSSGAAGPGSNIRV